MGRDKALLPFRGASMAQWIAAEVAQAAGSAFLVGQPERYSGLGYPVIADAFPGEGPLSGILTALRHTNVRWNLVVACDMPCLTRDFLEDLLQAAEANGSTTIPVGPSGRMEPLCAVWRDDALAAVETAFEQGIRKLATALDGLRWTGYPVAEVAPFQNVNTPEDWTGHAAK
jgi:molybdopterin-guanine dinucleotide biosynthesis protein A